MPGVAGGVAGGVVAATLGPAVGAPVGAAAAVAADPGAADPGACGLGPGECGGVEFAECLGLVAAVPGGLHLVEFCLQSDAVGHRGAFSDEVARSQRTGRDVLLDSGLTVSSHGRGCRGSAELRAGRQLVDEAEPEAVVLGFELEAAHHLLALVRESGCSQQRGVRRRRDHVLDHFAPGVRRGRLGHRPLVVGRGRVRFRSDRRRRLRSAGRRRGRSTGWGRDLRASGRGEGIAWFVSGCQGRLRKQGAEDDQSGCPPYRCGHCGLPLGV